jgi:hypothetical protein
MGLCRSIGAAVWAAVFAAGTFSFATPARSQSCDLGSIVNDFGNIGDALTGPACDQAYGDSAALTVAASALGGLLAADPSAGKSLCGDVQNLFSNGQSAANINQLVNNYFGSGIGPGSELIGALSQVAGPLATLSCACSIDQGVGQIANDIGSCFETAVCAGIQLISGHPGQPCDCTHPLPVAGDDCAAPLKCAQTAHANDPECTDAIYENVTQNPPNYQISGNYILDDRGGWDGSSYWCAPQHFCSCPSPMKLVQVPVDWDQQVAMFTCQCPNDPSNPNDPNNTHAPPTPSGVSPPLECICNNTGQVAKASNSTYGSCPDLTGKQCPKGQENVDNQCVTPCADPTKLQMADGSCCDPTQVSACGTCCPSGQAPNPRTGNCSPVVIKPIRQ